MQQPIPVERLVKCKMQYVPHSCLSFNEKIHQTFIIRDNLEFLQWLKRFWDSNYGGHAYDAVGRRKGVPMEPPATVAPLSTPISAAALSVAGGRAGGRTPVGGFRSGSAQSNEAVSQLQAQVKELTTHLEGLEKERDFYFEKVCKLKKKHDC